MKSVTILARLRPDGFFRMRRDPTEAGLGNFHEPDKAKCGGNLQDALPFPSG
jgi:hypothetical protein